MATASQSNNRVYLFRLQLLIIDGSTDVLRNIFNQKLQNVPLNIFLAREKTLINRLRANKVITGTQFNQLYPPGGQHPDSAEFDVTLIICLLRNLKSLGLNTNFQWNCPPSPRDTSVEADLYRLKEFRNEIAHISSTTGFQQHSFQKNWTELEDILLRLNKSVRNPLLNLKQSFNDYKTQALDLDEESKQQLAIAQWEEREKEWDTLMQQLKGNVTRIEGDVTEIKEDVTKVKKDITEIKRDGTEVKRGLTKMKEDVTEMKEDVTEVKKLKRDVTSIQTDVSKLTKDVQQVEELKIDVTQLKANVQKPHQKVTDETEHPDKQMWNRVMNKARHYLEKFMIPDKIVDLAVACGIFDQDEAVDFRKEKKSETLTKNIINAVKSKGMEGYTKFKKCLEETNQPLLAELLESFETGEEPTDTLLKDLREKRKREDLMKDLIATYRQQYATIQLSPLIEEEDTSLLKFYVIPDINCVKDKRDTGGGKKETKEVRFCDIFYKDEEYKKNRNSYKEIYLMADAGLGKTSFSKRLALTWCQSKDPRDEDKYHFSDEEIEILSGFDFVFLVLLRDSSNECSIEDMIFNQLFPRFGHTGYIKTDLENVLNKERCLVLLDGLDEWEHPPNNCTRKDKFIPHRAARETTTVLTTSRPWKLSVGGINASQIEQKLEFAGLNEMSGNKLKESFISHVSGEKDQYILWKKVYTFNSVMLEKRVSELAVIPILLMFMLCLWCDNKNLGNTLFELYSNIVELMLARTVEKYMNKNLPHIPAYPQGDIPHCFSENENCVKFYSLLMCLGELAFHTLFRETKEENILVFDVSVAKRYLKESLDFCLKTGLLTQTKDRRKLSKQTTKISFSHKSVQEYFAALYMCSFTNQSLVLETVKSKCKCIKDILEISKILRFISGINVDILSLISPELIRIVNDDELTRKYRRSTVEYILGHPLRDYQNLLVNCCKEMSQENQASLCIEDVFIVDSSERNSENLHHLTTRNQQNIKSVYIDMDMMGGTTFKSRREVIDYFSLTRLDNLEKIWYNGYYDSDVAILLKTSVKCLYLSSVSYGSPRLPCKEVTSLNKLEVIDISVCTLSHNELTEFYNYISRTKCLREIKLEELRCTDHRVWPRCPGSRLKFLQHSQLRTLSLWNIPVTEIEINLAILEKCKLTWLSNPVPVLKFRNHPAADSNLPGNTHVVLKVVTMAASSLRQLVDQIQELPQSVSVEIKECTIKPEDEFRRQIHRIETSAQFRMLGKLEEDIRGVKTFQFETISQRRTLNKQNCSII